MKAFRLISVYLSITTMAIFLQSCPKPMEVKSSSPGAFVGGPYEWDSTVTPTRKLTPTTVGYTQQFQNTLPQNGRTGAISFYKNDTLTLRAYTVDIDSAFIGDFLSTSTLVRFRSPAGYLRYQVLENEQVTLSNFLNPYTKEADTVRHYYHPAQGLVNYYP